MDDQEIEGDERFMTLLETGVGLAPRERESFLHNACTRDPKLLEAVRQQIEWQERMGHFLLQPLVRRGACENVFAPGDLAAGRFRIVRKVSEGGMGVVYEAIDEKIDHRCALKCAKPGFQQHLHPEARAALRVTHHNVCRVYEIHSSDTDQGVVDLLAMEYLEGETLSHRLKRRGRLRPMDAEVIVRQLCLGLGAAHRCGLIHRDLKSNNVMLTESEGGQMRAVIMDFGLAREEAPPPSAASALASSLRGALDYIAPELWRGERASISSDIYALGVIAHEMLTGSPPFASGTPIEQRLSQLPPAPSTAVAEVSSDWDKLILKCLHPQPAKRYFNTDEILGDLEPPIRAKRKLLVGGGFALLALLYGVSDVTSNLHSTSGRPPTTFVRQQPASVAQTSPSVREWLANWDTCWNSDSGRFCAYLAIDSLVPIPNQNRYHIHGRYGSMWGTGDGKVKPGKGTISGTVLLIDSKWTLQGRWERLPGLKGGWSGGPYQFGQLSVALVDSAHLRGSWSWGHDSPSAHGWALEGRNIERSVEDAFLARSGPPVQVGLFTSGKDGLRDVRAR